MVGGVGFEAKQQDSQKPVAVVTVEQANKEQPVKTSTAVKSVLGAASLASLLAGIRAAYKHTRQPEVADLAKAQLVSGAGFAFKALAVATVITFSGFSLIVVGVSALLNVNTPKQFGARMHDTFGDKYRLESSKTSLTFEELVKSIEERQLKDDEQKKLRKLLEEGQGTGKQKQN